MSSTVAEVIRDCAKHSIQGTLAAVAQFAADLGTRIAALRARLATCQASLPAPLLKASYLNTADPNRAGANLLATIATMSASLEAVDAGVRAHAKALTDTLVHLPDLLLTTFQALGVRLTFSPTSAQICPRVDAALRPRLSSITDDLTASKASFDAVLLKIDSRVTELQRFVLALR